MNTDLYAVSGTSPTEVQQTDRPAEAPQFKCPACPEVHGAANPESTINKREQSSQSVEINLPGDPTAMGDEELAHFCADTFIKFATAIPFIIELQERFKRKGKQWLQEVGFLGCSTWDRFCEKHFHRTRRAVNKAIAAFREQERIKALPPAAVEPAPAPDSDSIPTPSPAPEAKSPHDKSPNGHDLFVLLSWFQKSIRSGHLGDHYVDDALYCAVEMDLAGGTFRSALWNRLLIIASEDIGQSDRLAAIEAQALFLTYQRLKTTSNPHKPERLPLIDCVLRLAMAPSAIPAERKSRMVDHALNVVYNKRSKRDVPDYVLDKHTQKGRENGKGVTDFLATESAVPIVDPDRWLEDAKRILIAKERPLLPSPDGDDPTPSIPPTSTAETDDAHPDAVAARAALKPKAWELHQLLTKVEADDLYQKMMQQPWLRHKGDGEDAFALYYGLSYVNFRDGGGPRSGEICEFPEFLKKLADRISAITKTPINYIQCHKYGPTSEVKPHRDPKDMVVPMLVIGQERTFRVGGKVSKTPDGKAWFRWTQNTTPVGWHRPEEEHLLRHGSLLIFNGGQVIHSMFPAAQDSNSNPNGFPYRVSIIFRYTTPAMREFGSGSKANSNKHPQQYKAAVAEFVRMQEPSASDEPPAAELSAVTGLEQ